MNAGRCTGGWGQSAEDTEERAWHLALGAERPSEEIAGMLDDAARHAASRGAPEEGATLAEQAARLTPAGHPRRFANGRWTPPTTTSAREAWPAAGS